MFKSFRYITCVLVWVYLDTGAGIEQSALLELSGPVVYTADLLAPDEETHLNTLLTQYEADTDGRVIVTTVNAQRAVDRSL